MRLTGLILLLISLLVGCGQKGPLTLPDDPPAGPAAETQAVDPEAEDEPIRS